MTKKHSLDNHIFPRARNGFQRMRMKWKRKGEQSLASTSLQMISAPNIYPVFFTGMKPGDVIAVTCPLAYPDSHSPEEPRTNHWGWAVETLIYSMKYTIYRIFLLSATCWDFQIFVSLFFLLFLPLQSSHVVWFLFLLCFPLVSTCSHLNESAPLSPTPCCSVSKNS